MGGKRFSNPNPVMRYRQGGVRGFLNLRDKFTMIWFAKVKGKKKRHGAFCFVAFFVVCGLQVLLRVIVTVTVEREAGLSGKPVGEGGD